MKNRVLLVLSFVVCAGNSCEMAAYSRTTQPWSKAGVKVVGAMVGMVAGGLTKLITAYPPKNAFVGVRAEHVVVHNHVRLHSLSAHWSTRIATVVGLLAAGITWKVLSLYTARGYARAAENIMSGEKCSQPEVLELVQRSAGDAQVLSAAVVSYFAAQKNELYKAVSALEELSNQLSLAHHYFAVAKKRSSDADVDLMTGYQEILEAQLTVIKGASLLIKARPEFERQSNAELQELGVYAQFATASAIREAGHTSHTN